MLKTLTVDGFYDQKRIEIDFSEGLTILTGDNGAGKTTLLNLIFNILNGDFKTLYKTTFEKAVLELDVAKKFYISNNKTQIVTKIEVNRNKEGLIISYFLQNKHFVIRLKKVSLPWTDYKYDLIFPDFEENKVADEENIFISVNESLTNLIEKHSDLKFINQLKENIIYFPTYRRIDSDIIHLLEQNYPVSNEVDLYEINRTINNFPSDRRVVGVNDNDIDHLFRNYSDKLRKLNSEGLNIVLKSFIEEMIISTYKSNGRKNKSKNIHNNPYDKAPEQLIELSRQLGIKNINETEIKEYFAKQKQFDDISQSTQMEISIKAKTAKGNDTQMVKESVVELIRSNLLSVGDNNNLVMKLINLYDSHIKKVSKELEPFEYLKKSFKSFFKDKLFLELNNYNLQISRPFKNLSTGEKQLITILSYVALSLKMDNYQPLIIIDEPELSLHISWQMKLLEKLLELENINILIATHSPYIANSDYENYIWQIGEIDEY